MVALLSHTTAYYLIYINLESNAFSPMYADVVAAKRCFAGGPCSPAAHALSTPSPLSASPWRWCAPFFWVLATAPSTLRCVWPPADFSLLRRRAALCLAHAHALLRPAFYSSVQLYAELGERFDDKSAQAFALFKFFQSATAGVSNTYAPELDTAYQLLILVGACCSRSAAEAARAWTWTSLTRAWASLPPLLRHFCAAAAHPPPPALLLSSPPDGVFAVWRVLVPARQPQGTGHVGLFADSIDAVLRTVALQQATCLHKNHSSVLLARL